MKKCPTCEKTFDDAMRFCQVDGTPLVDEVPFDPYATIVGTSATVAPPAEEPAAADATPSQSAISVPEEILDAPNSDPLKTMYVSDTEMEQVLSAVGDAPVEEIKADDVAAEAPVPEVSSIPEPPAPSFSDMTPPPSPFLEPAPASEQPVPAPPMFLEPEAVSQEADTVIPPEIAAAVTPPPAPMQESTPPPDASWQNQQSGANAPPPSSEATGQSKVLAIVSLLVGILSIPLCFLWISPLTGLIAIITGVLAVKKAGSDPARYGGKALAIIGIMLGAIFLLMGLALWIVLVVVGPQELLRWAEEQQRQNVR